MLLQKQTIYEGNSEKNNPYALNTVVKYNKI